MTVLPTDDQLSAVLRNLQGFNALEVTAIAAGVSAATLFRHARPLGAANRPQSISGDTREKLVALFLDVGLLEPYTLVELRRAVEEIRRRAAERPNPVPSVSKHEERAARSVQKPNPPRNRKRGPS